MPTFARSSSPRLSSNLYFTRTLALVLLTASTSSLFAMGMPGGSKPVAGASNDLGLQELAKFAVEKQNAKEGSDLKLLKLVSASTQVVAGTVTKLKLWAAKADASSVAEYDAKVWTKSWENFKELSSFDLIGGSERPLTAEETSHLKEGKLLVDAPGGEASGSA